MSFKESRNALGLTLQAVGDALGVTREAVRQAEAGLLPALGAKLSKFYQSQLRKKAKNMPDATITFTITRRGDKLILHGESEVNFEFTDDLVIALVDAFQQGNAVDLTREL